MVSKFTMAKSAHLSSICCLKITRVYKTTSEASHWVGSLCRFSHVWLCDSTDHSPPGSSVRRALQARTLEWVPVPSSSRSSWPRDQTGVSCIAGGFFTVEPPGKPGLPLSNSEELTETWTLLCGHCSRWTVSCKMIHWIPNLQSLRLWPYLEIELFQI